MENSKRDIRGILVFTHKNIDQKTLPHVEVKNENIINPFIRTAINFDFALKSVKHVNADGKCTPGDAFCIMNKYMQEANCIDGK
ncbi:hypothetical protein MHK_002835 [Candidatus Magnetomorum sp. HK-1]|nr:hypothetical protein MHK_002835 [Candidatus Magnetomorum sp. HK-1]